MSGNILYNAKFATTGVKSMNGFADEHQTQTLKGCATFDGVNGTFNMITPSGHPLKLPKNSIVIGAYLYSLNGDLVAGPFDLGYSSTSSAHADNILDDVVHGDVNIGVYWTMASLSTQSPATDPQHVTITDTLVAAGNADKKVEVLITFMQLD